LLRRCGAFNGNETPQGFALDCFHFTIYIIARFAKFLYTLSDIVYRNYTNMHVIVVSRNLNGGITMRDFFSLDGAFSKYGNFLADTIILSLLWILFSLPIITIGASTTAMFFVSTRRLADREGYISSDFWMAFKSNFGKATKLWLLVLVLAIIIVTNIRNIEVMGNAAGFMLTAQYVLLFILAIHSVFSFPMIARFDMGLVQVMKSSFYMSVRHLLTSVVCVLMAYVLILLILTAMPVIFFAAPGIYGMGAAYMIMRVFKKYRPEMDRDPRAEIQEIEAQKDEERRLARINMMDEED